MEGFCEYLLIFDIKDILNQIHFGMIYNQKDHLLIIKMNLSKISYTFGADDSIAFAEIINAKLSLLIFSTK